MGAVKDLVGHVFGRLSVLSRDPTNTKWGKARFLCECECGKKKIVTGTDLSMGHTKSCGCWRTELPSITFSSHRMRQSAEYRIWMHMKTRCLNPKSRAYPRYGGRGITMCRDWIDSFEAFYRDMGVRPSSKHSIDRIDNDGNYEPSNCRWALPSTQGANRSSVRIIKYNGISDSMAGWSRRTGIPYMKLRRRIIDGWSLERALEAKDAAVRAKLHPGG